MALPPLEASFSPQRSWAPLFRAFLLPGDRKTLSSFPLRSCAPRQNLPALPRRFSGLIPPKKPCPFLPPEGLVRVGTDCSLELSDLSGSPSVHPWKRASPSSPSPLTLTGFQPYDKKPHESQGLAGRQLGSLPLRAPACLAFRILNRLPPLRKIHPPRVIFSPRRPLNLTAPESLLFAADSLSPSGRWYTFKISHQGDLSPVEKVHTRDPQPRSTFLSTK